MIEEMILLGLAGWRIANLLVNESGPGLIFERLRIVIGLKPGPVSGFFPILFSCMFCMTVWSTTFMWLFWYVSPEGVALVAAWALALIVNRLVNPD